MADDKWKFEMEEAFLKAKREIVKKLEEAGDDKVQWLMAGFHIGVLVSETAVDKGLPPVLAKTISYKMVKEAGTEAAGKRTVENTKDYYGPG